MQEHWTRTQGDSGASDEDEELNEGAGASRAGAWWKGRTRARQRRARAQGQQPGACAGGQREHLRGARKAPKKILAELRIS